MKRLMMVSIVIGILLMVLPTLTIQADDGPFDIVYFGTQGCLTCQDLETDGTLEILENQGYHLIKYEITYQTTVVSTLHRNYLYTYQVPETAVKSPILFVGNSYFAGAQAIRTNINNGTVQGIADTEDLMVLQDAPFMDLSFGSILKNIGITMLMGLGDAFNICAISMLLMFISFLATTSNKKAVVKLCVFYIIAVFLTYFFIGVLIQALLVNFAQYANLFAWIIIGIALFFFLLNLYDFFMVRKEKYAKVKNQLPKGIFRFASSLMKSFAKKIDDGHPSVNALAFLIGVIVALVEFPCTGQVYVVWLDAMTRNLNSFAIFLLFLIVYNILFVSPMIVIAWIAFKTQSIHGISNKIRTHMGWIKLLNALIFLFVLIYYLIIVL